MIPPSVGSVDGGSSGQLATTSGLNSLCGVEAVQDAVISTAIPINRLFHNFTLHLCPDGLMFNGYLGDGLCRRLLHGLAGFLYAFVGFGLGGYFYLSAVIAAIEISANKGGYGNAVQDEANRTHNRLTA